MPNGSLTRKMPERQTHCLNCGAAIKPPRLAYCSKECQVAFNKRREAEAVHSMRVRQLSNPSNDVNDVDDGEVWVPVVGYEGEYKVSNYGRVKSVGHFKRTKAGLQYPVKPHLLKQKERDGYLYVTLVSGGHARNFRVHRIVAQAFHGNPFNKAYVNHIDGNKKNNTAENLEWVTAQENSHHAIEHGLINLDVTRKSVSIAQAARRKKIVRDDGFVLPSITAAASECGMGSSNFRHHLNKRGQVIRNGHTYKLAQEGM